MPSRGVMDALMLLGPMKSQRTLGVSAGAMVMASYLAGAQVLCSRGRAAR